MDALAQGLAAQQGIGAENVTLVGKTTLAGLGIRPDHAVTVQGASDGFIVLEAPGNGADPGTFTGSHDKAH